MDFPITTTAVTQAEWDEAVEDLALSCIILQQLVDRGRCVVGSVAGGRRHE